MNSLRGFPESQIYLALRDFVLLNCNHYIQLHARISFHSYARLLLLQRKQFMGDRITRPLNELDGQLYHVQSFVHSE